MLHISLRDVAERTGVSFQTASKVLKGEGRVSLATRQHILEKAAELVNVAYTLARSLATSETRSIGFIASGLASFVLAPLMHGAEEEARARGYVTVFTLVGGDEKQPERLVHQLIERRVDGVVNAALTFQHNWGYSEVLRRLSPFVSISPVQLGQRGVVQRPAEVEEMLLGSGAFFQLDADPSALELNRVHIQTPGYPAAASHQPSILATIGPATAIRLIIQDMLPVSWLY